MRIPRRTLLATAIAIPGLVMARQAATLLGEAAAGATRGARPGASGTSATRCALCGSPDHAMLDPRCPRPAPRRRCLRWASIAAPSSRAPRPGPPRAPWPASSPPTPRPSRPRRDFDVPGQPARGQGRPHDLLAQLHRQLRPARVRARRRRRQGPAGRRLPGRRLQPARLHEGPLLPQPDLRRGPDHEAAHPDRRARLRRVPRGHLGRGPRPGSRTACGRSARRGAGTPSTSSARCRAPGTSRRAPTTAPARCWA